MGLWGLLGIVGVNGSSDLGKEYILIILLQHNSLQSWRLCIVWKPISFITLIVKMQ